MKYVKMLGLTAVAAVAAMAFAATAFATTLTSPAGTTYTGKIVAEALGGGIVTHNSSESFTCQKSVAEGTVEKHGAGVTVSGLVSSWDLTECGNSTFKVLKRGTLEIHATGSGQGTLTSTGMEIEATSALMTCIYTTNATDVGLFTGSNTTNATLHLSSSKVPRTGGSALCGAAGTITGDYKVTTPSTLYVD
jgi:hypothetical protein